MFSKEDIAKTLGKWSNNKIAVIITLIFLFPLGIYLMWKGKQFNVMIRVIVTVVIVSIASVGTYRELTNHSGSFSNYENEDNEDEGTSSSDSDGLEFKVKANLNNLVEIKPIGWIENPASNTWLDYMVNVRNKSGREIDSIIVRVSKELLDTDGYKTYWEEKSFRPLNYYEETLKKNEGINVKLYQIHNPQPWKRKEDYHFNRWTKPKGFKYTVWCISFTNGESYATDTFLKVRKQELKTQKAKKERFERDRTEAERQRKELEDRKAIVIKRYEDKLTALKETFAPAREIITKGVQYTGSSIDASNKINITFSNSTDAKFLSFRGYLIAGTTRLLIPESITKQQSINANSDFVITLPLAPHELKPFSDQGSSISFELKAFIFEYHGNKYDQYSMDNFNYQVGEIERGIADFKRLDASSARFKREINVEKSNEVGSHLYTNPN